MGRAVHGCGRTDEPAGPDERALVVCTDVTSTARGTGSAATGPSDCPLDEQIHIDLGFFDELSVRHSLAADCFAGVWARSVYERDLLRGLRHRLDGAAARHASIVGTRPPTTPPANAAAAASRHRGCSKIILSVCMSAPSRSIRSPDARQHRDHKDEIRARSAHRQNS